ncbi:SDR family oxidoreductase [Bacillus lacus]|uniref:SDR family oxidoreductase n=1 Tax=Metabacillus lacus TaxID=1983721 RepID=A0A7X2IVQ9_9BACI|nr:SDR family oxidoreductase [Metabacillus lacus]MRX70661.1 SDR family oxidoreductase [Metabacillus lacus]
MKKAVLVTGASGGIGSAIATQFAEKGYSVYMHYNRNEQSILELKNRLSERADVLPVRADLSLPDGVEALWNTLELPVEHVVLNSGSSYFGLLTDMTEEKIQNMIQLHLTSPVALARKFIPAMVQSKSGTITLVTSIWGQTGASCEVMYSTLKGAQNTFVKALAKELAPSGIRVNGVAPGAVATNMLQEFSPEELLGLKEEIPAGRFAEPEEIANAVSFLSSPEASYITGQILAVNGGWYT